MLAQSVADGGDAEKHTGSHVAAAEIRRHIAYELRPEDFTDAFVDRLVAEYGEPARPGGDEKHDAVAMFVLVQSRMHKMFACIFERVGAAVGNDAYAYTARRSTLRGVDRFADAIGVERLHWKFTCGAVCAPGCAWKYDLFANCAPKKFA